MLRRKKKQALTLLEIMIVIFLIGLIGSVIGYNMKGSLEKGKAFKTEQAMRQIHDILMLEVAKGASMDDAIQNPGKYLAHSGIVNKPDKLLKDGWGSEFVIQATSKGNDISITSDPYRLYLAREAAKLGKAAPTDDEINEELE